MMRTGDLISSAALALRGNPMRSALTALGVIIGVASVVAMVALGTGAQRSIEGSIASLGSNLIIVMPGAMRNQGVRAAAGGGDALSQADAEAIRHIDGVVAVAPSLRARAQVVANGANWSPQVDGVTPAIVAVRDYELEQGRFFDEGEERQARRVAVIGQTVVNELFPNMDPLGETIRVGSTAFEVIGVLKSKGQSGMGMDQDDIVMAPMSTVRRRIAGRQGRRSNNVSLISVEAASEEIIDQVQGDIEILLRERHRKREGDEDFTVQNMSAISAAMGQVTGVLTALLGGVSAVSLLVGGIGIMNIMLVSVTERTREIGLRKALGARQADILNQFALEAVTLSVAGGIVGLGLGALGAFGITLLMGIPFVVSPFNAGLAMGFSIFVGVVFGAYPAWRAARLDPIEALRRE